MSCPLYIDYTRECIREIEIIPNNTLEYCTSSKYKKCPFYRIIKKEKNICECIKKCAAFKYFQLSGFDKFIELSEKYCTSTNYKKCKRYVLKKKGGNVPDDMHPSGGKF